MRAGIQKLNCSRPYACPLPYACLCHQSVMHPFRPPVYTEVVRLTLCAKGRKSDNMAHYNPWVHCVFLFNIQLPGTCYYLKKVVFYVTDQHICGLRMKNLDGRRILAPPVDTQYSAKNRDLYIVIPVVGWGFNLLHEITDYYGRGLQLK